MNYKRIYEYRFKDVDKERKLLVWKEIAEFLYSKHLNAPEKIIDPAGGLCEFINAVPSSEKWTVDLDEGVKLHADKNVKTIIGNNLNVELPDNYFDGIFISNFLEHLANQSEVAAFLQRMYNILKKGGRIVIMGPNFRHTYKDYFNFADHTVILTELGVAEHLYGAGFEIVKVYPKFLPLSFRGNRLLPLNSFIAKMYFKFPVFWKILGQQFLIIAEKS